MKFVLSIGKECSRMVVSGKTSSALKRQTANYWYYYGNPEDDAVTQDTKEIQKKYGDTHIVAALLVVTEELVDKNTWDDGGDCVYFVPGSTDENATYTKENCRSYIMRDVDKQTEEGRQITGRYVMEFSWAKMKFDPSREGGKKEDVDVDLDERVDQQLKLGESFEMNDVLTIQNKIYKLLLEDEVDDFDILGQDDTTDDGSVKSVPITTNETKPEDVKGDEEVSDSQPESSNTTKMKKALGPTGFRFGKIEFVVYFKEDTI
jgi:hypothetical protein